MWALPRPHYRVLQRAQFPRGLPFEGAQQSDAAGLAWPGKVVRSEDPEVIAALLCRPGGGGVLVAHDAVPWAWFGPAVAPRLTPPGDPARRRHHPGVARHIHPGTQGQQRAAFGLTWTASDDSVAWLSPAHAALMQGRLGPLVELPRWLLRAAHTDGAAAVAELEALPPAIRATWSSEDLLG